MPTSEESVDGDLLLSSRRLGPRPAARSPASSERNGLDVTLLAGSRSDLGGDALAASFYSGPRPARGRLHAGARSADPLRFAGRRGRRRSTAPTRTGPGAADRGPRQPRRRGLRAAGRGLVARRWPRRRAPGVDVLYLHHLTPLNEAAARVLPGGPGRRPRPRHRAADAGTDRRRRARRAGPTPRSGRSGSAPGRRPARGSSSTTAAASSARPRCSTSTRTASPASPTASTRSSPRRRSTAAPTGAATWSRSRGAGDRARPPGSVAYEERDLEALDGTVLLAVGRFTEVKRLPLLIEAFARARDGLRRAGGAGPDRRPPRRVGGRAPAARRSSASAPATSSSPAGTATTSCRRSCAPATSSSTPRSGSSSARSWSRRWPAACR